MKSNIKNLVMISMLVGSISIYSCRNTEEKKEEPGPPMQNEMHQEGDIQSGDNEELDANNTAEFKEENMAATYAHYLAIKDALVLTDAVAARTSAQDLLVQLEEEKSSEKAITAARNISTSENVNEQREAFSDLTMAMEPLLVGSLESGSIYKQYCPMAFEGKGDFWYSDSEQIRNPYFGDKMLKCGRIEQTLN